MVKFAAWPRRMSSAAPADAAHANKAKTPDEATPAKANLRTLVARNIPGGVLTGEISMCLDGGRVLLSGTEVSSMRAMQQEQDNSGRDDYAFSSGKNPDPWKRFELIGESSTPAVERKFDECSTFADGKAAIVMEPFPY